MEYAKFDHIVALEGPDDIAFYHDFLEDLFGSDFLAICCDNKDGVLNLKKACDSYRWRLKPSLFYICDKDFDDILQTKVPGVYYTEHYSIESEFCTEAFAKYVIRREVTPKPTAAKINEIMAEYEASLKSCATHMKQTACLMIEARSRGIHPDFDTVCFADFFSFINGKVTPKEVDYMRLLRLWKIDDTDFIDAAKRWEEHLADDAYLQWVRGKYLTQIAKRCVESALKQRAISNYQKSCSYFGRDGFKLAKLALKQIPSLADSATAHLQYAK
mgnify:CR=1 FL=1